MEHLEGDDAGPVVMAIKAAIVCDSFDLGGTGKVASIFAAHHDRSRVRPLAVAVLDPGVRATELQASDIEVRCAFGKRKALVDMLAGVDIVHTHRLNMADTTVLDACAEARVDLVVETNVFGGRERSAGRGGVVSTRLFVSQMCAMRYRKKSGLDCDAFYKRHRTLYNPVDIERLCALRPSRFDAQAWLGLDPGRPTIVRVGRDDDRKWGNMLVAMLPHLYKLVPDVQVVFVGATPYREGQLRDVGVLERVRCIPPSSDSQEVASFYAAADVVVSASAIGESFGVAIAEAMALGIPVVSNATPWADNAQVEIIDSGVNGWIANHPLAFAEATADLLGSRQRRSRFGEAAATKAANAWHPAVLTRRLETLFESLLTSGKAPDEWCPGLPEERAFERVYAVRAQRAYRPLRWRERWESREMVVRERAWWMRLAARDDPWMYACTIGALAAKRLGQVMSRLRSRWGVARRRKIRA